MCKHVAAALYGVGARLDEKPQLLFALRGVDESDLLARAGDDLGLKNAAPAKVLDSDDVAALFGLEMAEEAALKPSSTKTKQRKASDASPAANGTKAAPAKIGDRIKPKLLGTKMRKQGPR